MAKSKKITKLQMEKVLFNWGKQLLELPEEISIVNKTELERHVKVMDTLDRLAKRVYKQNKKVA